MSWTGQSRQHRLSRHQLALALALGGHYGQLYVDFDLSPANLPPGTRLAIRTAVLEVSDQPHLGCLKFTARFGAGARALLNAP